MQFHHLLDYCVKQIGRGTQVKLENLNAGTINQNYCLDIDGHRFLVKQFAGNRWLPTDRKHIFALQKQLSQIGIAPQPIHLSEKQDVYIEQWLEFEPLDPEHAPQEQCMDVLAAGLIRIHNCEISGLALDIPSHWQRYLKSIADPDKKWRKKTQEYTAQWRDYVTRHASDFVLCHNDLQLCHIAPEHGMFLDWEYAGNNCRFFDLLTCILANQFDQNRANALIRRYIELSDFHREEVMQRIRSLQPMVIFTHQLWWQANEAQNKKRKKAGK